MKHITSQRNIEKAKAQIAAIKRMLAAEKKKFGEYDDSRGRRYIPPGLYILIKDFKGGFAYIKWFQKTFPDDIGLPIFLFEWAVILFKTGQLKQARRKVMETYFSNTYLFDVFFRRPLSHIDKYESSNLETMEIADYFKYSHTQPGLEEFSAWVEEFMQTDDFLKVSTVFIEVQKRLKTETDKETRSYLIRQEKELLDRI